MRSESTSALGQPRETKPTLALLAAPSALLFSLRLFGRFLARGESGERKARKHVAGLILQLLLHLQEHVAALLHVGGNQALHRRPLKAHELLPPILVQLGVVAVQGLGLLLHALLD